MQNEVQSDPVISKKMKI